MAESVGAKMITIHGRVREDYYSGEPDYNAIAKAKRAVKIPVIANGGVFTVEDANIMMDRTGADGVMLARGAIANPFLFSELTGAKTELTLKQFIIEHIKLLTTRFADKKVALEFRKFTPYYFKGMVGVKELKTAINSAERTAEIIELIEKSL
jgi:tRNA-dihydrouridine synthase B